MLAAALEKSAARKASFTDAAGGQLKDGVFTYDAETERHRWRLTDEIIRRAAPGPREDPHYLAVLARQAASVEYVLRAAPGEAGTMNSSVCDRVVLGTIGEPRSHAFTQSVGDGVVIAMSAGMIDWMYQAAKANVLSWVREEAQAGSAVTFGTDPVEVAAQLDRDPRPLELLGDTLATWLYDGVPRASYSTQPPPEYHPPLALLINGAERFVLAHEYGHVLLRHTDSSDGAGEDAWSKELHADAAAFVLSVESGAVLDRLPANIALTGAIVSMHAHATLQKAITLATTGEVQSEASSTHPPFALRMEQLTQAYIHHHPDPAAAEEDVKGMHVPAVVGDLMFERVRPGIEASYRAGRPLHHIWTGFT